MTKDGGITDSVASLAGWTWVWARFRSWWWTGKPCLLQSVGSQRVGHDRATEKTYWLDDLVVFPNVFNLSLHFTINSSWSDPQSAHGLIFSDWQSFFIFRYKEYSQSGGSIDHLVMSMCRVVSCIVGRVYLLWPVCSIGKTLLAFALLHFVLQGQTCLLFQVSFWLPTFAFQYPMMKRTSFFFFLVLVPEGLVDLHRTVQLQLLWH